MDINKIITESLESVIKEGVVGDVKEKAAEVGKKIAAGAEVVKEKAGEVGKKIASGAEVVKEKAGEVGKKGIAAAEGAKDTVFGAIKENPKTSAAVAAALAAGVGAVALRKKIATAMKSTKATPKKKK